MSRSSGPGVSTQRQAAPRVNRNEVGGSQGLGSTATATSSQLPASSGALVTGHLQDVIGNSVLLGSLAGNDFDGFGGVIAGQVGAATDGYDTAGFESNTLMARVLRDAIGAEAAQALSGLRLGAGAPIPSLHKERMERAFGHDFGHVRIHTDSKAEHAASAVHAYAFALGSDIFFGQGTWAPGTTGGDRLLAHELTHVVQHDEGRIPTKGSQDDQVSSPSDPLEREAYSNELNILSLLRQVDAEIATESHGNDVQPEGNDLIEATDHAGQEGAESEDLTSDLAETVTIDMASDLTGDMDMSEDAEAMGAEFDLGGFTQATPADAGADAPSDTAADADGTAMRDADGMEIDTLLAQKHIKQSKGTRIDAGLARRLGTVLGHDVQHAIIHIDAPAARAAEALSAKAFALGSEIFFSEGRFAPGTTEGDQLLAHELTHVVQHDEGRLPSSTDLEVSSPTDGLEQEARDSADKVGSAIGTTGLDSFFDSYALDNDTVAQQPAESGMTDIATDLGADAFDTSFETTAHDVMSAYEDTGLALREADKKTSGNQSEESGGVPVPAEMDFLIVGKRVMLDVKDHLDNLPAKGVEIPINKEPIPGIKLLFAKVDMGDDGSMEIGVMQANLALGDFVNTENVELDIDKEYKVTCSALAVKLKLGDIEADASVTIDDSAISATINAKSTKAIKLHEQATIQSMELAGTYEDNSVNIAGEITMRFGDWAEGTIEARYFSTTAEGTVDGEGELDMRSDSEGGGSDTQSGGDPAPSEDGAQGDAPASSEEVSEDEDKKEEGSEEVTTEPQTPQPLMATTPGSGKWNALGVLRAISPMEVGPVTFTESELTVELKDNTFEVVKAKSKLAAPKLQGSMDGQYDIPSKQLSGKGEVKLTEELRLEELGVTIKKLEAATEIEANRFKTITGEINAIVDFEDQPTFDVTGSELKYDFEKEQFSGIGKVKTMRELTFGSEDSTHIKIAKGAGGEVTVEEGKLKKIDGGLDFKVLDSEGEIGAGKVTLDWGEETDGVSAEGNFALTSDYMLPDRKKGPATLKEGGELKVTVTDGSPESAEILNLDFELVPQGKRAKGKITGTAEGDFQFEEQKFNITSTAKMAEEWPLDMSWGKFQFDVGGRVEYAMEENEVTQLDLRVPYTAEVTKGKNFTIRGEVDGKLDPENDYAYSGTIDGQLQENLEFDFGKSGKVILLPYTEVSATIEANELDELNFDLAIEYFDKKTELTLKGMIKDGKYKLGKGGGKLSFDGNLALLRDIVQVVGEDGSTEGKIKAGPGLHMKVVDNKLEEIGGNASFEIHDKEGALLDGTIKDLTIDTAKNWEISGEMKVFTSRDLEWPRSGKGGDDSPYSLKVLKKSSVEGKVEASKFDSLTAELEFEVHENTDGKLAAGKLNGTWAFSDDKFSGDGELKLTRDFALKEPTETGEGKLEGWQIQLKKDSSVNAKMTDNVLRKGEANIKTEFNKGRYTYAEGSISGQYLLGETEDFSGTAQVKLVKDLEWAEDARFKYFLVKPTDVTAQVEGSNLTSASGKFVLQAQEGETPKIDLTATADYTPGTGLDATAEIKVLDDMLIADKGEWKIYLAKDSGGEGEVVQNELKKVGGTIKLRASQDDKAKVEGDFKADYAIADGSNAKINADGKITVLDDFSGAEGEEYKAIVQKDTSASGKLEDGALTEVDGTIKLRLEDDDGTFLTAEAKGEWRENEGDSKASVEGEIKVLRDKVVTLEPLKITVRKDSGGTVVYKDNELLEFGGGVNILVSDEEGDFVEGSLEGTWTKETGADGKVTGKVIRELNMGTAGEYTFFVNKDSDGWADVAKSELTKVGGVLKVRVDDDDGEFILGDLDGTYVLDGDEGFTGTGSAEIKREKELAKVDSEALYIMPGTGAKVGVTKNAISELSGQVNLSLRDTSEYLKVEFGGEYNVGAKSFSGGGKATVTKDKKLFGDDGGYSFWLQKNSEAAAQATIKDNKIEHVGGNVPFMVKDADGPLLEGAAQGDYFPKTGMFSGSGQVYLARDVEYELGEGKLVFKKGSGGKGTVKDSKLEELGGKLSVEVHDADGLLVSFSAEGTYDALNNEIKELEGKAKLERPIEPLGEGILIINSLDGSARIEKNELKWVEGKGAFTIIPLNNMTGEIQARYEVNGGVEKYTGKGKLNFTLFEDAAKGRSMSGEVEAELLEGDKFKVKGEIDYSMSEMISGKVGVEMDETMDPTLNASMSVNTELVPGQDIFQMDLPLIPHTVIPVYGPIALGFGAKGSMGLSTLPLNLSTTIGISNWKPISTESQVPDFDAELALDWGLNFSAMLAAWLTLELTAGIGSAGAGIRGEVQLDAPLRINPYGKLHGGKDGFRGELGIGIKLEPTLTLRAIPFVQAQLKGFDPIKHDFAGIEKNLGPIFKFEWGTKYTFGDENKQTDQTPQQQDAGAAKEAKTEHASEPATPSPKSGTPKSSKGGAKIGNDVAGKDGGTRAKEGGSEMDELMKKIDDVKIIADGLGAIGYLIELIVDLITALMIAGPAGLAIMLVWKIISGQLTWSKLVEAVTKVVEAVKKAAEMLRPHLPDWVNDVIDFFSGDKPSLLGAFFGADDKMRDAVRDGVHSDPATPFDMRVSMIDEMMDGYCGGEDEGCILQVLYNAESRGDLHSLIGAVSGGPDQIDYKLDGSNSTKLRKLFDRNGVKYKKSFW